MFRAVLIVVPLGLLVTVTLRPTIVTHLASVVVDLLLALIIVWHPRYPVPEAVGMTC